MDISKIDKNFSVSVANEKNIVWYSALSENFSLYGIFYDAKRKEFRRMPYDVAGSISESIIYLSDHTAGGKLKFRTDSQYIFIRATIPTPFPGVNMCLNNQAGFALYVNGQFVSPLTFSDQNFANAFRSGSAQFTFTASHTFSDKKSRDIEIYFPLYNGVKKLSIGLNENAKVTPVTYKNNGQIVFYGSSITQGGCSSHPGNDYISNLERKLDIDTINLGFSGNALAEKNMTKYLAELNPSVYVLDYDHNAPDTIHLLKTHYALYDTIRKAHPNTPVILITKPDFDSDRKLNDARRKIIKDTYLKAKRKGDGLIQFIDGEKLFGKKDRDYCTVDGCHPNDLGFYRMAEYILPYLKKYIK